MLQHAELHELTIAHVDCDAFYASVEKRSRPELEKLPLIVGGKTRGVVLACCYVARRYGVHSAMPMYRARQLCPGATVVSPDMSLYAEVSEHIRSILAEYTDRVEPISIDEAFLDLSPAGSSIANSPASRLCRLASTVEEREGIPVTVGLSYNKFLAKLASGIGKPRGFTVIGQKDARVFLSDKPVSMIWGVGGAMRKVLADDGITLIGQLARMDEETLRTRYGKIGERLFKFSRGIDERQVNPVGETKSISSEKTFESDISDPGELGDKMHELAATVARRLDKSGLLAQQVTIKLKTARFRVITRSRKLTYPTKSRDEILRVGKILLADVTGQQLFRLIGIGVQDLVDARNWTQGDLFADQIEYEKADRVNTDHDPASRI